MQELTTNMSETIKQMRQELEKQRKLTGRFAEESEHWWKQYHHARRRLIHARLLLGEFKLALQTLQGER